MTAYREAIIRKYRRVAHLPDFLFGFTFPLRRRAIQRLQLQPGERVVDIGCSTGANFSLLQEAVGSSGAITGVDISPDMVVKARARVQKAGWRNVTILEAAAEEVALQPGYDALLLFAMHDVLTSPQALDNILAFLAPGGRVVAAGPKLATRGPGQLFNPMIHAVYRRFAVNTSDMDLPWRLLAERVKDLRVEEQGPGLVYLVSGTI